MTFFSDYKALLGTEYASDELRRIQERLRADLGPVYSRPEVVKVRAAIAYAEEQLEALRTWLDSVGTSELEDYLNAPVEEGREKSPATRS